MVSSSSNSRYTYICDRKSRCSVEEHHVVVRNNVRFNNHFLIRCFSALLFLLLLPFASLYLCLLQGNSFAIALWSFLLYGVVLLKLFLRKTVEKESVVVMPAFGVQLETHYLGGKVVCRFIPVDKILKPILVERVTPVTCYWNLCLVVREEAELTAVFNRLRPPLKMLIPIRKALCAATDQEETSDTFSPDGQRD